jgi:hypothetical protein
MTDKTASDERTIWQRLIDAQAQMKQPELDGENSYYKTPDGKPSKYASLKSVMECVLKPLNSNGLALTQPIEEVVTENGKSLIVSTEVHDEKGERILLADYPVTGTKSQELAAAITYARRIMLCSAFGRVGQDDDDGNGGLEEERQGKLNQFRDVFGSYVKANKHHGIVGKELKKQVEEFLGSTVESSSPGQIQKAIEYIWDLMDKGTHLQTSPITEIYEEEF